MHVAELEVFGFAMARFPVNVFALGHEDIHGLLGMNFLSDFNFEIRQPSSASSSRESLPDRVARICHDAADPRRSGRTCPDEKT